MKTRIFTMFAIAAAMASCSKSEIVNIGADSPKYNTIGFATYSSLNQDTKGKPVNSNTDFAVTDQTFETKAYIDIAEITDAYLSATIKHNGSIWNYVNEADAELWPSDATQTLDFFAYTNNASDVTINRTGFSSADYTIPAGIADQKDFMYAEALDAENVTPSDNVSDGAVKLVFNHALTQINVTAQMVTDGYTLLVDEVQFCNVNSKGTMTYPIATEDTRLWKSQGTVTSYTITNAAATTPIVSTDTEATAIDAADGNELILMPQIFDAWAGTESVYDNNGAIKADAGSFILVKCTVYKEINGVKVYYIGDKNGSEYTAIPLASVTDANTSGTDAPNAISPEWKDGRNITYNLQFGVSTGTTTPGGGKDPETGDPMLVPIKFTTDVAKWEPVGPTNVVM